jgi:thioredoxin 1
MSNNTSFHQLISGETPVLVDFFAEWCGPCKMMAPILEDLKNRLGERIRIIKIDIDKNPDVANQYGVMAVPTLFLFKKGIILWKNSGVVPAHQLEKIIQQYL